MEPSAGDAFRDQLLELMQNQSHERDRGFVVFVHGDVGLHPVERICHGQTYNRVLTARYGATGGSVLHPLLDAFRRDAAGLGRSGEVQAGPDPPARTKAAPRKKASKRSKVPPQADAEPPLGVLVPGLDSDPDWSHVRDAARALGEGPLEGPWPVLERLDSALNGNRRVGQRVVLLCELEGVPSDASAEDLGFDEETVAHLASALPERMGLVFSGVPDGVELPELGGRFLSLVPPTDYGDGAPDEHNQKLLPDLAAGDDQLRITSDAHALADAVLMSEAQPPMVIGVLGGWGSGKSFVLHLLRERMRALRSEPVESDGTRPPLYVGHPYLIRFDAWTYAKANLWASLMQRILVELDRQLTLEQNLKSAGVDLRTTGIDIWDIIDTLSTGQLDFLEGDLGQRALDSVEAWRNGESQGKTLWGEIRRRHQDDLRELMEAERELETLQSERDEQLDAARATAERERVAHHRKVARAAAGRRRAHETDVRTRAAAVAAARAAVASEAELLAEELGRRAGWSAVREGLKELVGARAEELAPAADATLAELRGSVEGLRAEASVLRRLWEGLSRESIAFLAVGLVGAALFALPQVQGAVTEAVGLIGAFGGVLASAHASLARYTARFAELQRDFDGKRAEAEAAASERVRERTEEMLDRSVVPLESELADLRLAFESQEEEKAREAEARVETLTAERLRSLDDVVAEHDPKIRRVEVKVEKLKERAGAYFESRTLHELVRARVESGYYEEHLGLVHQVQEDLEELTDALMPAGGEIDPELFPRGDPRVILVIDDLDRCPPSDVVRVLEAVQLLVKTRLFVVVLAMDVRYVTRALEREYGGILTSDGDPSGLDYIEKIVQIPYRVRPIAESAMEGYLRSQMEVVASEPVGPHREPAGGSEADGMRPARIDAPRDGSRIDKSLPPEVQRFEAGELELVRRCALAVEISPRSTKRLVNVLKLIKNIWYRRGGEEPELPAKSALVLLLSLAAAYPEPLRRILAECQRALEQEPGAADRTVQEVLADLLVEWVDRSARPADWSRVEAVLERGDLLDDSVRLGDLGVANIELIRSFSFVGELESPRPEITHELGVAFRGPVALSDLSDS